MLNTRENGNITKEISGLALAVLCDRYFIELFDLCESNNKPLRKFRVRQSLQTKKHPKRVVDKDIFLGRF
jgi:hypothetical protein